MHKSSGGDKMYERSIMNTMLELVSVPGISGTVSEALTAGRIYDIIGKIPYFKDNRHNYKMIEIEDDEFHRSLVYALFLSKKPSQRTIILTGHYDVVGIEEFGKLKNYAFSPEEYTKRISELSLDKDSEADLKSGEWIFGRGTSDMKYGLALHLEVLRELSSRNNFSGNILFVAVPGEESNSEGMLAAAPLLLELKEKYSLEYSGLLLSECCLPKYKGDNSKKVYMGTCGKIMPLFFFQGKETHVCEAFNGINPDLMASELNKLMELNTDLCDVSGNDAGMPPVCLKQTDLKELYSVQSPLYAASYYNVITLNTDSNALLNKLKDLSKKAFENAINEINKRNEVYSVLTGKKPLSLELKPCVMTFYELCRKAEASFGESLKKYIDDKILQWKTSGYDIQTISIKIIKELCEICADKEPKIVIAFAPPYYPYKAQKNEKLNDTERNFYSAVDAAIDYAESKFNEHISKENYFMGICDLSYTGLDDIEAVNIVSGNIPGINNIYKLPLEEIKELNIPGIVFGGWGKDFHKYTERLNIPYSLEIVPYLYEKIIYSLFEE